MLTTAERQTIEREVAELRDWWAAQDDLGLPRFGEMGSRLAEFRTRLHVHFQNEQRVAARDHLHSEHVSILRALDDLIERLRTTVPPFRYWREAREEFDGLVAALERTGWNGTSTPR